jgi:hypothetical protein
MIAILRISMVFCALVREGGLIDAAPLAGNSCETACVVVLADR